MFFADTVLFLTALNLIGANTVVPDFVSHLTSSQAIIGLSGSIYQVAFLLPQLFFAQVVNRGTRRKPFIFFAIPSRLTIAILAVFVLLAGPERAGAILIVFLILYTLFGITDGLITLAWADLVGSVIPDKLRGILFGTGQFGAAVGVLITSQVARILLGPSGPSFPYNYGQLFAFAAVIFFSSGVFLNLIVEEKREIPLEPGPSLVQYLPFLRDVLKNDRQLQRFVLARLFFDLASMAMPFYIVFAATSLSISPNNLVSNSVLLATLGTATASLVNSWLSRRSGSRAVIRSQGFAILIGPVLALLAMRFWSPAIYGSFILVGLVNSSTSAGYFDWLITHAPPSRRPIYAGLTNTISAASHLSPILGGLILSVTGNSYVILFGLSIVLGIAGMALSVGLSEPRHRLHSESVPLPVAAP